MSIEIIRRRVATEVRRGGARARAGGEQSYLRSLNGRERSLKFSRASKAGE